MCSQKSFIRCHYKNRGSQVQFPVPKQTVVGPHASLYAWKSLFYWNGNNVTEHLPLAAAKALKTNSIYNPALVQVIGDTSIPTRTPGAPPQVLSGCHPWKFLVAFSNRLQSPPQVRELFWLKEPVFDNLNWQKVAHKIVRWRMLQVLPFNINDSSNGGFDGPRWFYCKLLKSFSICTFSGLPCW